MTEKTRERNSVRTRILYGAVKKANKLLVAGRPLLLDALTFHSLRQTYARSLGAPRNHSGANGPPRSAHDPARLHRRDRNAAQSPG
jgi:hypothetical protein